MDALICQRTYYGITDERVIIRITGPFLCQTRSLDLRNLSELGLTERGMARIRGLWRAII